jgi:hypothetical protein
VRNREIEKSLMPLAPTAPRPASPSQDLEHQGKLDHGFTSSNPPQLQTTISNHKSVTQILRGLPCVNHALWGRQNPSDPTRSHPGLKTGVHALFGRKQQAQPQQRINSRRFAYSTLRQSEFNLQRERSRQASIADEFLVPASSMARRWHVSSIRSMGRSKLQLAAVGERPFRYDPKMPILFSRAGPLGAR